MQIVVRQISGLGNQLFQYAAGVYFANHFGGSMRLAIDPPKNAHSYGSPRPFLLSHFSITAPYSQLTQAERLILSQKRRLQPILDMYRRVRKVQVFREELEQRYGFPGVPALRRGTESLYLSGYWQSQQIVGAVDAELRKQFRFAKVAAGRNAEVLNQIRSTDQPVSLHVRRGDYTLAAEGMISLPMEYYNRAIDYFRSRLVNPVFFIFSDDIPYTREHLPRDIRAVFVDHNNDETAHEDMRLMSACRHHIIANSSFSWWGAWLNSNAGKMVFAPKFWHLTADSYFPGLFPSGWTIGEFEPRQGTRGGVVGR